MKNTDMKLFFRSLMAIFAVLAMTAVSCEEPEPPVTPSEPVFPSLVEKNDVEPGSVLSLSFEAAHDWTVTVPSESLQWFWIQDDSFKVDKLSGKVAQGEKERITVSIGVSDTEEFDTNRSCDVVLTMGGKSQVIARYMRPAMNRSLSVYVAKTADGAFVMDETGNYEYEAADAASAALIWSDVDSDFRLPVRVEANCEWVADTPDWMDMQVPENTGGTVEFVMTGASLDDASGKVVFKAGDSVLKELEVSVPSCAVIDVYSTQTEDEYFLFDDSGDYLYTDEPVEEFSLIWPGSDFRMPVLVDSRCDWTLELPQWLTVRYNGDAPEDNLGAVRFILMGDPRHYPLEDTTEKIVFKYESKVIKEIDVTIPGCKDRFGYGLDMSMASLEFSPEGYLKTTLGFHEVSASAWFTGTSSAAVYAVETVDGIYTGNAPAWLNMDVEAYVQGAEVLQNRSVSVKPSFNDGTRRTAFLLFSKDGDLEAFFGSDGSLKPEMEDFAVSIVQYGSDMEYITMTSSEEEMALAGAAITEIDNPRFSSWFGKTDHMYELTYSNPYARDEAYMTFARPYSSYKVFNSSREDKTSDSGFWLSFSSSDSENRVGVIDMYRNMDAPETKTVGYVVFYDTDGSTLAIVYAVYDPEKQIEVEVDIEFIGESAAYAEMVGATLEEVTEESDKELYDIYKEYVAPIYHLTYRTLGMPMRISIPSTAVRYNPNPYAKRNNFRVNGLDYDDTAGEFELIDGGVDIYMTLDEGSTSDYERGQIFFHRSDNTVVLVLVCTLDLTGTF